MRILLIGADGQVGHALQQSLIGLGEVVPVTRSGRLTHSRTRCMSADLSDVHKLPAWVTNIRPDVVINAAAYTAVDRAEDESDTAFRINAEAVGVLAQVCFESDALLVHYSTDYVFSGPGKHPWREDDPPVPVSVYGASKLAGEVAIRRSGCQHLIFRAAWMYGPYRRNFMRTILRLIEHEEKVQVVCDQIGCPTPAAWVAQATALVLARREGHVGTWHLACEGETSWHGFATAIAEEAMAAGLVECPAPVEAICTKDYPTRARRPQYSALDTRKLATDFDIRLPHWREGVAQIAAKIADGRFNQLGR